MKTLNYAAVSVILATALLLSCNKTPVPDRVPSEETIRSRLEGDVVHRILIGQQVVTTGGDNFEKREISQDEFTEVVAWEKAGLIKLDAQDVMSESKSFSWDDFYARTQRGQVKRITVTPTEMGKSFSEAAPVEKRDAKFLYALFYTHRLSKLLSSELKSQAASDYCVITATVDRKMTDIGKKVHELLGHAYPRKIKVIVLLKFDPFDNEWKVVASDIAHDGEPIKTNNVNQALLLAP